MFLAAFTALMAFVTPACAQFSFKVKNDTVKTSPLQTVKVDVLKNDSIPCANYSWRILSSPPSSKGANSVSGDIVVFTPAVATRDDTVRFVYEVDCNGSKLDANLVIIVAKFSMPVNAIDPFTPCAFNVPQNVDFYPTLKYVAGDASFNAFSNFDTKIANSWPLDGFSMPLVGDLNNDGRPEIVAMGLTDTTAGRNLSATGKYIVIFNGQTGNQILKYQIDEIPLRNNPEHNSLSKIAIADMDRNGRAEIVVASSNGKIFCYTTICDLQNRIIGLGLKWKVDNFKFPIVNTNKNVYGAPVPYISDLDADGKPEVIVYNKIYDGTNGNLLCTLQTLKTGAVNPTIPVPPSRNDSASAVSVWQSQYAYVGRQPVTPKNDLYTPCIAIADVDADGILDIAAGSKIYRMKRSGNNLEYDIIHGPSSVTVGTGVNYVTQRTIYLADGFTCMADIDMDGKMDVVVVNMIGRNGSDNHAFIFYVWDPMDNPTQCKAASIIYEDGWQGYLSYPFVGDINGKLDSHDGLKKLPEICFQTGRIYSTGAKFDNTDDGGLQFVTSTPIKPHPLSKGPNALTHFTVDANGYINNSKFNNNQDYGVVSGFVFALTWDGGGGVRLEERLKMSWALEVLDRSGMTGITVFDFDNDGAMDICYKDESSVRVISASRQDYIPLNAPSGGANAVRFNQTGVKSYTGYEAPVIADVNMDGSADIITMNYHGTAGWMSRSFIYVWEHQPGKDKWAPSPPVWNQAIYYPLQINADLTVPPFPRSRLTPYKDRNGNVFYPYNGHWVQQPIVRDDENFIPVLRIPDAVLTDMKVEVDRPGVGETRITLTVKNVGSASINARTPVSFFHGGVRSTGGYDIYDPLTQYITQFELGEDIFPDQTVVREYIINQSLGDILIWASVAADNTKSLAVGYDDCNFANNQASGADCPGLLFTLSASSDQICGSASSTTLSVSSATSPPAGISRTYKWFLNETLIPGANLSTYVTNLPGRYKCFVTEGICRAYSNEKLIIRTEAVANPDSVVSINGASIWCPILNNDVVLGCSPVVPTIVAGKGLAHGQAYILRDTLYYTPDPGYLGDDTVWYGLPATTYVRLSMQLRTHAMDDAIDVVSSIPVDIDVLANDILSIGCTPTVLISTLPKQGTAYMAADNKVRYTASSSYSGLDTLTYELECGGITSFAKLVLNTLPSRVIYVKEGGRGLMNGSSWANAYDNLYDPLIWVKRQRDGMQSVYGHDAINSIGDTIREIWVAKGQYIPEYLSDGSSTTDYRDAVFVLVKGVKLYGGFPDTANDIRHNTIAARHESGLHPTILSGDLNGVGNVAYFARNVILAINIPDDNQTVLDGFTIRDCNSDGTTPVMVGSASLPAKYGAIVCLAASPLLANLKIVDNYGDYVAGISLFASSPTIFNTEISHNTVRTSSIVAGVYITDVMSTPSRPVLTNVTVAGNTAANMMQAGGIMVNGDINVLTLNNSIVWGNTSGSPGNAVQRAHTNLFYGVTTPTVNISNSLAYPLYDNTGTWNPAMGNDLGGNIDIDPFFVSLSDYSLQPRSQAINGGNNSLFPVHLLAGSFVMRNSYDLSGNLRLVDNRVDMGAYEQQGWTMPPTSRVFYVKQGGAGNQSGDNWENAYPNLADPVRWAALQYEGSYFVNNAGDTIRHIWVAQGTYTPWYAPIRANSDRDRTFVIPEGLSIYGGFPRKASSSSHPTLESRFSGACKGLPCLASTVLSGDLAADDVANDLGANKTDNVFHVLTVADVADNSHTVIDGFTVSGAYAGGIDTVYVEVGRPKTRVYRSSGGGIYLANASPLLRNLRITNNHVNSYGGGVFGDALSSPTLVGVNVNFNRAKIGGGFAVAGGAKLLNVASTGNYVDSLGGGFHAFGGSHVLTNTTISGNYALKGGGVSSVGASELFVNNSIVWGNEAGADIANWDLDSLNNVFLSSSKPIKWSNSLVRGSRGGISSGSWLPHFGVNVKGNLDTDPIFVRLTNPFSPRSGQFQTGGDYRPELGSRALYNADSSLYMSFFSPSLSTMSGQVDLDGLTRYFNGSLDMGAYEYQLPSPRTFDTMYVKQGGAGNKSGDSWANACAELDDPLHWAALQRSGSFVNVASTDTIRHIWVAAGTYKPKYLASRETMSAQPITDRDKAFALVPGVKIYGGFPANANDVTHTTIESRFNPAGCANRTCLAPTILSGDLLGDDSPSSMTTNKSDNAFHVVVAADSTRATVLDGFIVEGGYADGSGNLVRERAVVYRNSGGGVYCSANMTESNSPVFVNLIVRNNYARVRAGGIYMDESSPRFTALLVSGNEARDGGGLFLLGQSSSPLFSQLTLSGNTAKYGGGFFLSSLSSPSFFNSAITGNRADSVAGGVVTNLANVEFINVTVSGNRSVDACGGLSMRDGSVSRFKNSIVWGNFSTRGQHNVHRTFDPLNLGGAPYRVMPTVTFTASVVAGSGGSGSGWKSGYGNDGGGNSDINPLFEAHIDPSASGWKPTSGGNYKLKYCSPVLNTGSNALYSRPLVGGFDLDGAPRLSAGTIDPGAYEKTLSVALTNGVFHVKKSCSGTGDGSSWENACGNLADPLLWAALQRDGTFGHPIGANDTIKQIWVAEGRYVPRHKIADATTTGSPTDDRDKAFVLIHGVKLYGGFPDYASSLYHSVLSSRGSSKSQFAATILDGDLNGDDAQGNLNDNVYHVVVGAGIPYTFGSTQLDGFTIRGGNANGNADVQLNGEPVSRGNGGGITLVRAVPLLLNLNVENNRATLDGGGMYLSESAPKLNRVSFTKNTATGNGGGLFANGRATNFEFVAVDVSGNSATNGGGIMLDNAGHLRVGFPHLIDVLVSGNSAVTDGGGICAVNQGGTKIVNLTLAGNYAGNRGGGMSFNASDATFDNSIVSHNSAAVGNPNVYISGGNTPGFSFSLVEGSGGSAQWNPAFGYNGGDNIDTEPRFAGPLAPSSQASVNGDYRLINGSPAIDRGSTNEYETVLQNTYLFSSMQLANAKDLDENKRLSDLAIDMGAYEKELAIRPQNGVFYVKRSFNGDADGSLWSNSYGNLADPLRWAAQQRAGILVTAQDDTIREIWVAEGLYKPMHFAGNGTDNRDKAFVMVSGVKIYGGFPDNADDSNFITVDSRYSGSCNGNSCLAPTILSGDLNGDDTSLDFALNRNDNVHHVVIAAGIPDNGETALGGFTISGGRATEKNPPGNPSILVNNKTIPVNSGGALHNVDAAPAYSNLLVTDNHASVSAAGIYVECSSPRGTSPLFSGVTVKGNKSDKNGAAVALKNDTTRFVNCVLTGNSAGIAGGAIDANDSEARMLSSTVAGNHANSGGALRVDGASSKLQITNSIIYGNESSSGAESVSLNSGADVEYHFCHVEDCFFSPGVWNSNVGTDGTNNDDTNPAFVAPVTPASTPHSSGNYRLLPGSGAMNTADSILYAHFFSPRLTNADVQNHKDADGLPRFVAPALDRGAYQAPPSIPPTFPVMYVKGNGNGNGSSWANAYPNLADPLLWANMQRNNMAGVVAATDTIREIWVAEGLYLPLHKVATRDNYGNITDNRHKAFLLVDGVKIYGGFPANADDVTHDAVSKRPSPLSATVLNGALGGNDSVNHVIIASGLKPWDGVSAVLDGFIVSGGKADNMTSAHVRVNGHDVDGGTGGGLLAVSSTVDMKSMSFLRNKAYGSGGGIYVSNGKLSMSGGSVGENTAAISGGGGGGGIYAENSDVLLNRVSVDLNSLVSGSASGGGVYGGGGSLFVTRSEIRGNSAINGGGLYLDNSAQAKLIDVLIAGNASALSGDGGAVYVNNGNLDMVNVTVGGNKALYSHGSTIYNAPQGIIDFKNGIVWGNVGAPFANQGQVSIHFAYSIVGGCGTGNAWNCVTGTNAGDNIDANPWFTTWIDPADPAWTPSASGDYRLQNISPAINNGSVALYQNAFSPPLQSDADVRARTDPAGQSRLSGVSIDRGAYESSVTLMAVDDFAATDSYNSVVIDPIPNDLSVCAGSLVLGLVSTTSANGASMSVDPIAKTVSYRPAPGFDGIDQFDYYLKCNTDSTAARVYVAVLRPIAKNYFACDGAAARLGVKNKDSNGATVFSFDWYDGELVNANQLASDTSTFEATKSGSAVQSYWVEAHNNGSVFPRYKIELMESDECGGSPSLCSVNGTLLFREDFGGNRTGDPAVSQAGLAAGTDYTHNPSASPPANDEYLLTKNFPGNSSLLPFADHTSPTATDRGYMMMINATDNVKLIYSADMTGVCRGMKMHFSSWTGNLVKQSVGGLNPKLRFTLHDMTTGDCVAEYYTGNVPAEPGPDGVWRIYGFSLPIDCDNLRLSIYNDVSAVGAGNDLVIDDVEMRSCVSPLTLNLPVKDTLDVCEGTTFTFDGSYTDVATFGNDLKLRLEYNSSDNLNDPAAWSMVPNTEQIATNGSISTNFPFQAFMTNIGYYRLVASDNSGGINNYYCRAMSRIIRLDVTEAYIPPDIRLNVTPTIGSTNLRIHLDSLDFPHRIEWIPASAFTNHTLGTIDVSAWTGLSSVRYHYDFTTAQCGTRRAKVYVRTIPMDYNKSVKIDICISLPRNKVINLDQILGMRTFNGQLNLLNDPANVFQNNLTEITLGLYAGARMFNAELAFLQSIGNAAYDYKGDPNRRKFEFEYVDPTSRTKKTVVLVLYQ